MLCSRLGLFLQSILPLTFMMDINKSTLQESFLARSALQLSIVYSFMVLNSSKRPCRPSHTSSALHPTEVGIPTIASNWGKIHLFKLFEYLAHPAIPAQILRQSTFHFLYSATGSRHHVSLSRKCCQNGMLCNMIRAKIGSRGVHRASYWMHQCRRDWCRIFPSIYQTVPMADWARLIILYSSVPAFISRFLLSVLKGQNFLHLLLLTQCMSLGLCVC